MELDFLIFPAPKSSYTEDIQNGELIWIPRKQIDNDCASQFVDDETLSATKYKDFGSLSQKAEIFINENKIPKFIHMKSSPNMTGNYDSKGEDLSISTKKVISESMQLPCSFISERECDEESNKMPHEIIEEADQKFFDKSEESEEEFDLDEFDDLCGIRSVQPYSISDYSFAKKNTLNISAIPPTNFKRSNNTITTDTKYLPCLFLQSSLGSSLFLLYFHGNGEDINQSYDLLCHLRNNIEVNIIAMEYPSYGIYQDYNKSNSISDIIIQDALILFDYLTQVIKVDPSNIILIGRSIGSGPATHLAAHRNPGALILVSAFTSLRKVAKDIVGKILSLALKDRFNNQFEIQSSLLQMKLSAQNYYFLLKMEESCGGVCEINLPKSMTHTEFDFYEDFSKPLMKFLHKNKFDIFNISGAPTPILPYELFTCPNSINTNAYYGSNNNNNHNNDNQSLSQLIQTQANTLRLYQSLSLAH